MLSSLLYNGGMTAYVQVVLQASICRHSSIEVPPAQVLGSLPAHAHAGLGSHLHIVPAGCALRVTLRHMQAEAWHA